MLMYLDGWEEDPGKLFEVQVSRKFHSVFIASKKDCLKLKRIREGWGRT